MLKIVYFCFSVNYVKEMKIILWFEDKDISILKLLLYNSSNIWSFDTQMQKNVLACGHLYIFVTNENKYQVYPLCLREAANKLPHHISLSE